MTLLRGTRPPASTTDTGGRLRSKAVIVTATLMIMAIDLGVIGLRRLEFARLGLFVGVLIFGIIVVLLRGRAASLSRRAVIIIAAACQLPGLVSVPVLSDDAYRYVWDGRVQLAGIDPYRYPPLSGALAFLRDPILFPPGAELPVINRSWVHTIYPPVAELWFTAVAAITPWRLGTFGVQLGAAVLVVITVLLLTRVLTAGQSRRRPVLALIYGACPATTLEAANGAHVDTLAALFLAAMGLAVLHRRKWLTGLFLGLAGAVKLVPLLLLPIFLRRGRRGSLLTAVGSFALGYLPHLIAVGGLVVGFLPGYLAEEGFDGRRRFALLILLPEAARLPVALLLAAAVATLAVLRTRREPLLQTCCWLYGAAFLIATPAYPWYLLPLMVLAIMAGRLRWLALWPAAYLSYLHDHNPWLQSVGYGLAAVVLVTATLLAARDRRRIAGVS
ncbi:glycosyltransferase 87 family protein [Microlunatus soli]|uniref:DUF2029 domain-containing protein n=1 Tax=Microlunatus soli TaxID=630515 RepID=A0A1H1YR85_9ACTN|nr:glycosyltransferase 87 family protein [Microlunatus soli]SDT23860.1 Protein of unknown function [Microlunatus soli]